MQRLRQFAMFSALSLMLVSTLQAQGHWHGENRGGRNYQLRDNGNSQRGRD